MNKLNNIRIVLCHTSHPGNIGSAARAMKTMGLSRLHLVKPRKFPHAEAVAMASGATDVLDNAQIFDTLDDALAGCALVIGLTARQRELSHAAISPRAAAAEALALAADLDVALVFGGETSGLSNEELIRCQRLAHIPANPDYSSLNLAAAVQVLAYELRVASEEAPLLALMTLILPVITAGNSVVALASRRAPYPSILLGEMLATSDLPGGVVNLLTGDRKDFLSTFATHEHIRALAAVATREEAMTLQQGAAESVKRVKLYEPKTDWFSDKHDSAWAIRDFVEAKTVWHPVGS